MRIVVPYTRLSVPVLAALDATGRPHELVEMTDDEAYWRLLRDLWSDAETFAIVEHDIVVHPTVFDELDACPEQWCGFPHLYVCGGESGYYGLGCVRFRASLLQAVPDAMEQVGEMSDAIHPMRHWCTLDKWLQAEVLPRAGMGRHHHPTVLGHEGRTPAHGCI